MRSLQIGVVVAAISFYVTNANAGLRETIANRFSSEPDMLIINIPPRPDIFPGAIFTSNMRIPIKHGDASDKALHRGQQLNIDGIDTSDVDANAKASIFNILGMNVDIEKIADVSVSIRNARIIDMDYSDLKQRSLFSAEALKGWKAGRVPVIVVKSYEGIVYIEIKKKYNMSEEAWIKLRKKILSDSADDAGKKDSLAVGNTTIGLTDNNLITYTSQKPFVFAFEVHQAVYDVDIKNPKIIDVVLSPIPRVSFEERADVQSLNVQTVLLSLTLFVSLVGCSIVFLKCSPDRELDKKLTEIFRKSSVQL